MDDKVTHQDCELVLHGINTKTVDSLQCVQAKDSAHISCVF